MPQTIETAQDVLETQFEAIIATHGLLPIARALHNACVHGEPFTVITEDQLKRLFDEALEPLIKIAKEIEE